MVLAQSPFCQQITLMSCLLRQRFEELGVEFVKRPSDGKMKGIAFIKGANLPCCFDGFLFASTALACISFASHLRYLIFQCASCS